MKPNPLKQIGTFTMALMLMLMFSFASNIGHAAQILKVKSQTLKAKPQTLKIRSTRSFKGKIGTVQGTHFNSTVYVEVYKLVVHDDGDNASPGDWIVAFGAGRASDTNPGGPAPKWPRSGTKNIRSGHTYFPRELKRKILNVRPNETIRTTLGVIDCDGPNLLLLSFHVAYPIFVGLINQVCLSAEEAWEASGENDVLVGNTNIYSNQWQKGVHFARRFRMSGLDVTAYFHAGTNPHSRSGGGTPIKPGDQGRPPIHRK